MTGGLGPFTHQKQPFFWRTAGGSLSKYLLTLYVTGSSPRAKIAIANLDRLCKEELLGQYELEIVDVLEDPQRAEDEKILATPTLIKNLPLPLRRVIGDLSDKEKVLLGLEVSRQPSASPTSSPKA
ncbi:MAG TPA: circadian clock KaiB family protein [Gemmatimonadaceae bacterium]|nr:circadian clock KaiB family protein [Gemmatimonadaceae bacterium]